MLDYYFDIVFRNHDSEGKIHLRELKNFAENNGAGQEGFVGGYYDPEDEDFKEGYLTLDFWESTPFEGIAHIENKVFFDELTKLCQEHIKHVPNDKEFIEGCLDKIKKNLSI